MTDLSTLIVDDDPDIRQLFRKWFERSGFAVREAGDGWTALRMLDVPPRPNLVCVDIVLPGISGLELCEKIRSDPMLHRTAILVITARGMPQDIAEARSAGANAVLVKPIRFEILMRTALVLAALTHNSREVFK
ncbi:MAG: response regulator [Myxococcales bacterium]